jgi:two-component system, OmpR family, sensor histidine kinase BaeS
MKFLRTFGGRLWIGHILPVLLLIPLLGLGLIYLLKIRLIMPALANEMIDQAVLVERLTRDRPGIWTSTLIAQELLDSIDFRQPSWIGLLSPQHVLLATNQANERSLIGKVVANLPDTSSLVNPWWSITPGNLPGEQILDVVLPVIQADGQIVGLVRIYRQTAGIEQSLATMRWAVWGVLLAGLVMAVCLAVFLSGPVERQIKVVTETIAGSPVEGPVQCLPEKGVNEISDLARAYNRLQDRRQELLKTRQLMLANLIHEIGRPLGSLRTALHALQTGAVNDRPLRSDLMKGMAERIDRMGRLLEDLALIYKGVEPQEFHLQSVQINEWMESLAPVWAESARQKQIVWEVVLPDDIPIIQTDPDRLAQALSNLVNNSIKFTPAEGKITLTTRLEKAELQFLVSDTGAGIPAEDQRYLFVPFYRRTQSTREASGLGLGLSITKSIIEALGGKISLISTPGVGSTFTITLPLR